MIVKPPNYLLDDNKFSERSLVSTLKIPSNRKHMVRERVLLRKKTALLVKMLLTLLQRRICWTWPCLAESNGDVHGAKAGSAGLAAPGASSAAIFGKPDVISCTWNMLLLHFRSWWLPRWGNDEHVGAPLGMTTPEEGRGDGTVSALPGLYYGVGGERDGKATRASNPSNKNSGLARRRVCRSRGVAEWVGVMFPGGQAEGSKREELTLKKFWNHSEALVFMAQRCSLLKQNSRNCDEADNPGCLRFLISACHFPRSSATCKSLFLSPPWADPEREEVYPKPLDPLQEWVQTPMRLLPLHPKLWCRHPTPNHECFSYMIRWRTRHQS